MANELFSIIDFYGQESAFATEFRRILHNLLRARKTEDTKSILVTSSTLSEGKSSITSLLSITSANRGLKTLLVDCDLRRPNVHKLFKLERERGLSEILSDGLAIKNATKKTSLDKLDIITAGAGHANPSEIFDSPAIGRLVEESKFYYDLILIDAAPIIPVSDPMLLAPEMDGVVLVIKAGETQREVVNRAVDIVQGDASKLLGVILNNSLATLPHYYDYDYYGYKYLEKNPRPDRSRSKSKETKAPVKKQEPSQDSKETDKSAQGHITQK